MAKARIVFLWRLCIFYLCWLFRIKGHGISILVPLNVFTQDDQRAKNWRWLERYWRANLPGAEIVIGADLEPGTRAFSKSASVNDAARKSHGELFVIVDADIYISADAVLRCAKEIRLARKRGRHLWFLPYRQAFRLTRAASTKILNSDPRRPIVLMPTESDITNVSKPGQKTPPSRIAHWYGAMIHIVPREGFQTVGGWDERFRGWGGEDHAAMAAMDTLYGPHKTLPSSVTHIWHPVLVPDGITEDAKAKKRLWPNQESEANNNALSMRYYAADRNPAKMRALVDEYLQDKPSEDARQLGRLPDYVSP